MPFSKFFELRTLCAEGTSARTRDKRGKLRHYMMKLFVQKAGEKKSLEKRRVRLIRQKT